MVVRVNKNLEEFLALKGVELTEEQYDYVFDVCFGTTHVANWSVAGSGKSLCLELIKEFLGDECVVCATTGAANSRLFDNKGGQGTASSVFSLPLGIHNHYHEKKIGSVTSNLFASSDLVKVVIVEEAGMLNPDQLNLIMKRVKRFNRAYGGKRKARNIKIVLQGDQLQLGAILNDEEKIFMIKEYGDYFLPLSSVYKDFNFKTHIFSKVLRTTDKTFQACLDVLRYGQEHRYDKCLEWMNKRYIIPPEDALVVTTTNKKVEEMNDAALSKNPNQLFELEPIIKGKYDIKNCPVDPIIKVKIGAPVVILINDTLEGKYCNGSYGYVTDIVLGEGVHVKLAVNNEEVFVPMFEFDEREYFTDHNKETGEDFMNQRRVGTCTHYCIKVAAALSVHRVQGMTINSPYVIDLGWGFNQDQSNDWGKQLPYVAWSRATSVENVFLAHPMTRKHIKVDQRAVDWVRSVKQ